MTTWTKKAPASPVILPSTCQKPRRSPGVNGRLQVVGTDGVDIHDPAIPWSAVMVFLNAKDLLQLAVSSQYFYSLVMEEEVWKQLTLRLLKLEAPCQEPRISWRVLYANLFDETSHMYTNSIYNEKHIDRMRVGTFLMKSSTILATDTLKRQRPFQPDCDTTFLNQPGPLLQRYWPSSYWEIHGVKPGIWVADLHLMKCPVCSLPSCEGTMQTLDARNWELFLTDQWKAGEWKHVEVGSHESPFNCKRAACGVFDAHCIASKAAEDVFSVSSWAGGPADWQPKGIAVECAVAASTNLQHNEGVMVKCEVLRGGEAGPILAVRISQQLI